MRKQNNFRLSKTKNNILYILSGVSLALFAGLMLFPTINETTYAEGDEPDDGITVVANNNIEINLLSTDEGYYKIAKDTVTVSTGSEYGYTLYLSTDSAAHQSIYLNGDTSSESRISGTTGTYESPAALADEGYSWGWAVPGISHFDNVYNTTNPDTKSKFAVMPLENKIIHEYTTEATEDTTDVYYGFKLEGTLEPGEYETAISYTAVSADAPLVARAILGDNGNLNFVYDRNTYTAGDTYTDNIGETEITNIYEVPMDSVECTSGTRMPWYGQRDSVTKIFIDTSFLNARPTGTCGWFSELKKTTNIYFLQNLNTSSVTDMSYMFYDTGYDVTDTLSLIIGGWDTGSVTNMRSMFSYAGRNATTWNIGDISDWDTSSVTDMMSMFENAGRNATTWSISDIGDWDTGNVIDMSFMFCGAGYGATAFNLDLGGWDTGSVINMDQMFTTTGYSATTFSLDLGGWNTGRVTNMWRMFFSAGYSAADAFNLNLNGWDIGNVTRMTYMFNKTGYGATTFDLDLNGWNAGNVTNMEGMFMSAGRNATTFNLNLSGWNTSNTTSMASMFSDAGRNATTFNLNLSGWNTNSVTDMRYMLSKAGYEATTWNIGDISSWDVTKVTNHTGFIDYNAENTNASVVDNQPNWPS